MRHTLPNIPEETSLAGKTVLIIGGNSGLGLEFARECLLWDASRVIITARTDAKGIAALTDLCNDPVVRSTSRKATLELLNLDLDDYSSASQFIQDVKEEVPELDILLCNAGVNLIKYQTSKSGHERVMQGTSHDHEPIHSSDVLSSPLQVNCYSHLFIVLGLLPLLQATAIKRGTPSRVTFVSSFSHMRHSLQASPVTENEGVLGHFDDRTKYQGPRRYHDSKLAVNALVQRLGTIVPSCEVIVNAVCPGVVATNFHRNLPWWLKPAMSIYNMIHAKTVEDGAWILLNAAAVTGQDSHGKYLQKGEIHGYVPMS